MASLASSPPVARALGLSRHGLFWPLHITGWAAYFLLGFLSALSHGKGAGYWVVPFATACAGFAGTLGLRYLLRASWGLPPARMLALAALPVLLASALMGAAYVLVLLEWCDTCRPSSRTAYFAYAVSHVYVVLAWVGLYLGIKYYRQLQDETRRTLAANAMAHQAQLKMLRYQLNPHFLFNTLNAISTLVLDRDNATANRMVQGLSAFLRHSLDNDPMQRVTLKQELDALNLYLGIEKVRFAERLQLQTAVEGECWNALLPSLLLQPLVENAIKYAVARQVRGGTLGIAARRDGDVLVLEVSDDGPGCGELKPGQLPSGNGVGLRNTHERLQVLYGERASVEIGARAGGGTCVRLRLPFERAGSARE